MRLSAQSEMARECITALIDKSSFSRFLLAKLQIQYVLRAKGERPMKAALTTIPKSTDAAFKNILERIEQQDTNTKKMAYRALTWCYYARRPLWMNELQAVIVVEEGDSEVREEENPTTIVDCCLSFIAYDSATGIVGFVHPSVQRWFADEPQKQSLLQCNYLAKTCLTYLNFDVFEASIDLPTDDDELIYDEEGLTDDDKRVAEYVKPYPCYRYVAQFWGDHTRAVEEESTVQNMALVFLATENRRILMLRSTGIGENECCTPGQTAL